MWEGERLRSLIKDSGFTITEFAGALGVSRKAVNDWVSGTVPSGLHLVKISQLLSASPHYFFSFEVGRISIPLHRKKGAAKVKEAYKKASLELAGEYENMFRKASSPGLERTLRIASNERQAQIMLAQQLRELSKVESHKPMDYKSLFELLVQLKIITIFRRFPAAIKGYAFFCRIHNHRVIFLNTSTNVLDLIFPVLHEIIHAIRSGDGEESIYDDDEEGYCDRVAGLIQFPQEYVNIVVTALEGKSKPARVNTLKRFSSDYGHSLYGIAEQIRKSGSEVLMDIPIGTLAAANTNLKKDFYTIEEVLFDHPEPRTYVQKLKAFSPIFVDIIRNQINSASKRKIGEWLGLGSVLDARDAIEELSRVA